MGTILIVRHGETLWNAEGRIQGHTDVELSEEGLRQAQAIARRLAHAPIAAAYASDMKRTTETARVILGERSLKLNTTPHLREYHKGIFEGLTAAEMQQRHPEIFAASLVKDLDYAPPGGETIRQTTRRMAAIIQDIKARHLDETTLVVGHGGSLRAALVSLLELPLEANWKFVMGNCSLSIVDTYHDNAVLRLYNDTSHLAGS